MKDFSPKWKSSKDRKKQRKYIANAPLHIKSKFMSSHLSEALRKKYGIRSVRIRKGDKVKITLGQYKSKTGTIETIDMKNAEVTIDSIFTTKRDGSKSFYPIHPSNLEVQDLNLNDQIRKTKIESQSKTKEVKK